MVCRLVVALSARFDNFGDVRTTATPFIETGWRTSCATPACFYERWRAAGMSSLGNEDELAASRRRLALPGFSGSRQRHGFSFNGTAASSGVLEDFGKGCCFLL